MKTTYNKWIIKTFLLSLVIPGIVAGINYFMDPLWYFSTSHRYNQKQDDFNERQQKTNFITYHDFDYDGLVIGSSTSTNINQHSFKGIRVYNYAFNGLLPVEYLPYIKYARERNGRDFKYIFIGLDFLFAATLGPPPFDPVKIFADTNSLLYRIKTLISLDTLMYSRRNIMNYLYGRHMYYDRNNVKYSNHLGREAMELNISSMMNHIEKSANPYSFKNFKYSKNYRSILKTIRDQNPETVIIPFTTPVVLQFMAVMVKYNLFETYEQWIRDIVEVYGECYNFMFPSAMSKDTLKYFHDPNHYYTFVADMMVDAMFNRKNEDNSGICIHITRANLNEKLSLIRKLFKESAANKI